MGGTFKPTELPLTVEMTSPSGEVVPVHVHTGGEGLPRVPRVYFDGVQWLPIDEIASWELQWNGHHGEKQYTLVTRKTWRSRMRKMLAEQAAAETAAMRAAIEPPVETVVAALVEPSLPVDTTPNVVELLAALDAKLDRIIDVVTSPLNLNPLYERIAAVDAVAAELLKLWKESGL